MLQSMWSQSCTWLSDWTKTDSQLLSFLPFCWQQSKSTNFSSSNEAFYDPTLPTRFLWPKLQHKEGWTPKNWCFWVMMLEKTLEVPWTARILASLTQQTWVWANSGRQWRTGKPVLLQPMGVRKGWTQLSNWITMLQQHHSL